MESLSSQDFDILQTRLFRPQLPGSLLVRPALVELLDFATPKVLTLVIAPAGFGKTTLVSSRLDEMLCPGDKVKPECLPSAWLAIDENDHNFIFFLRHFTAALRKIFPEAFPETYKLIYNPSEINLESISLVLTNEIAALSQRFVMVLDDFHRADCPQLLELLSRWAKHWPLPMHLVIISRTQPPLPLAGLKSQGKINDIRSRDLRFSPREAEDYISLTTTRDPSEKTLFDLLNQIEGWAAGLKLVSIALNQTNVGQDIEPVLSLGKQDIIRYLADEVFGQMTAAMQRFLMKISILDAFCVSLCLALVDEDELDESVERLLDNINGFDLFITALQGKNEDNEEWFRMHHLMRDLMQKRLVKSLNPEQVKALHLRAVNWYAGCNLLEEALKHAFKANDSTILAEILDQAIFAALDSEDHILMVHLLQYITDEMITTNPQFLLYKAWLKLYSWDIVGIKDIIGQAEKIMKTEKPDSMKNQGPLFGQLAFFKGFLAFISNNCQQAVKFYVKALDAFPNKWNYARGIAVFYHGISLQSCEGTQKVTASLQQSYRELDDRDDSFALQHIFALALIFLQDGDLKASEHYARLLLDKARKNKALRKEGYALIYLGNINYLWNRLDLAEKWYQEAYRTCSLVTAFQAKLVYIGLALVLQAGGKFKEALEINKELIELEIELFGQVTELTQVNRLRILTSQNQWKEAEQWADAYTKPFADAPLIPDLEDPQIFKARVLIARNDPKDLPVIMEILDQYMEIASKTANNRCKADALALLALAESNAGNNTAARDLLIESLKIAARGKMIRLYLDLGAQMHELLKQAAPVAEIAEFVQDLLTAFTENTAGRLIANQMVKGLPGFYKDGAELPFYESLSIRETEVLRLMAEAISLQEIADQLFITYATAKRHTINIYSKLGVHNRWEAVAFARKNGII
jgi:LuxR family transcriptional regulator, maltose regulon positive regulatory protein